MLQRRGQVVRNRMVHVQHKTSEPLSKDTIVPRPRVSTDAYSVDARWQSWGDGHTRGSSTRLFPVDDGWTTRRNVAPRQC